MPSLLPIPNPVSGVMNAIADGAGDRFKDMIISLSKICLLYTSPSPRDS